MHIHISVRNSELAILVAGAPCSLEAPAAELGWDLGNHSELGLHVALRVPWGLSGSRVQTGSTTVEAQSTLEASWHFAPYASRTWDLSREFRRSAASPWRMPGFTWQMTGGEPQENFCPRPYRDFRLPRDKRTLTTVRHS
jgi:hypothetical protein